MDSFFIKKISGTLFFLILTLHVLSVTWYVYPSSYTLGAGTGTNKVNAFKGLQNINWTAINPGDTVLLLADKGYFTPYPTDYLRPTKSGTAALPIVIKNEPGSVPILDTSLILFEANVKYIYLEGIIVRRAPYAAITIRNGASRILIKNCTLKTSWQGLNFMSTAGDSCTVMNCAIDSNLTNGIGINDSCLATKPNIIKNCTITNNGHHGIELNGSYYIIESNTLNKNGNRMAGTSAIHIYGGGYLGSPEDGFGHFNIIRYNLCRNQMEPGLNAVATDGNGIQLDQFTSHNKVYYNICLNNDCAGIALFDSHQNEVYNNSLFSNGKNSFANLNPPLADLSITSTQSLYNQGKHSYGNSIKNNLVVSYKNLINYHAVQLDDKSSLGNNLFSNNGFWNVSGSNMIWRYLNQTGNNQSTWNTNISGNDFITLPLVLPSNPVNSNDIKIQCSDFSYQKGVNVGLTRDYFGNIILGTPSIGAHQGNVSIPLSPLNITPVINLSICSNNSTTLSVQSSTNTINWYATSTSTSVLSTGTLYNTPMLSAGNHTYYAQSENSCTVSARTAITITVNIQPIISVTSGSICSGKSYTMTPIGANTYTYSNGNAIVSPTANSVYYITGTSSQGCISSNTAVCTINVKPSPIVSAVSNESLICVGQTATLTAIGANTYTWNTGAIGASIVVSPIVITTYTVEGTKQNGCSNTTIISQSVSLCTDLEKLNSTNLSRLPLIYPNPNSGNLNIDLTSYNIEHTHLQIISTIGETVTHVSQSELEKGIINIQHLSSGVYFMQVNQGTTQQIIKFIKE